MKSENILAASLVFSLGMSLYLWAGEGVFQKKKAGEKKVKSLIRKELLLRERKKLEPPRRNIFSPRNHGESETFPDENRIQENSQEMAPVSEEERPISPLNIRYIGYICSGEKIVGLIIVEGNAWAVEKGEVISERVRIGEITKEEIEIIGPDSEKRKYSLEGERE